LVCALQNRHFHAAIDRPAFLSAVVGDRLRIAVTRDLESSGGVAALFDEIILNRAWREARKAED